MPTAPPDAPASTGAVNIHRQSVKADYIPHHQPFQYYASTANPTHTRPTSIAAIGNHRSPPTTSTTSHDFTDALAAGNMPAVSFLKAPGYQDAHAGYSDPLDEQTFVVNMINAIEKSSVLVQHRHHHRLRRLRRLVRSPHQPRQRLRHDRRSLNGTGVCISATAAAAALPGVTGTARAQGRCGTVRVCPCWSSRPGRRRTTSTHTVTDQAPIVRFIEDVFLSSQRIGGGSFDASPARSDEHVRLHQRRDAAQPQRRPAEPHTGAVTSGN